MERYVCIHGHFYQPPRENPWLEFVELQDSAYPYHDWNARVTAECYAPNATSRIMDEEGRIAEIVNNYARISFNFGPTLLAWLAHAAPDVIAALQQADQESQERFSGHGSAMAQCYNHMIMPLANRRDKITQVRWGIHDFRHHFGRKPEGMWLPETAVDVETLEILAENGIHFTILSPFQAGEIRKRGGRNWTNARGGTIDPTTPYEQQLPSGRRICIFFYDGPVSGALAFEHLLRRGEDYASRLFGAFSDDRKWDQLVHVATDGESYGHHHKHGDMALAYALHYIEKSGTAKLTNYGEYLARHRRLPHVQIAENTAWSCSHGVERWRSHCGCSTGGYPHWNQHWRTDLRRAVDWLRDTVAGPFEQRGKELFQDPWAARDDYIAVVLDRSPENIRRFFHRHAARELNQSETVTALKLMELQRFAMLMYTSCGWFFDELSGIETVQVIQYAGRAVQLAEELFGDSIEGPFRQRLSEAKSNIPEHQDGRLIYEKWVKPARIGLPKVTAHYAASTLFEDYDERTHVYCFQVTRLDELRKREGRAGLVVGQCEVSSEITRETLRFSYLCVHMGDHNLVGGVREYQGDERHAAMRADMLESFGRVDFPEIVRRLDVHFGGLPFSLTTLFREEQRRIVELILDASLRRVNDAYRQQYEQQSLLAVFLGELGISIPTALRTTAQMVLNADLHRELERTPIDKQRVSHLLEEAKTWQVDLDTAGLSHQLSLALDRSALVLRSEQDKHEMLTELENSLDVVDLMPFPVNLIQPQNIVYKLWRQTRSRMRVAVPDDRIPPSWEEPLRAVAQRLRIRVDD